MGRGESLSGGAQLSSGSIFRSALIHASWTRTLTAWTTCSATVTVPRILSPRAGAPNPRACYSTIDFYSLLLIKAPLARSLARLHIMSAASPLDAARAEGPKTSRLFGMPLHGTYAPFLHNTITRLAGVDRTYEKMESTDMDAFLEYARSEECCGSAVTMYATWHCVAFRRHLAIC